MSGIRATKNSVACKFSTNKHIQYLISLLNAKNNPVTKVVPIKDNGETKFGEEGGGVGFDGPIQ